MLYRQKLCDGTKGHHGSSKPYLLSNTDQPRLFNHNVRLEDLRITADYLKKYSAMTALQIEQRCPQHDLNKTPYEAPSMDQSKIVIFEINPKPALQDPADTSLIIDEFVHKDRLECHRMLIIRKKKMKNHRRKRLWKKMWPIWRKKFSSRFKKTEVGLRAMLTEKVNSAKNFNAENYVKVSKFIVSHSEKNLIKANSFCLIFRSIWTITTLNLFLRLIREVASQLGL